MAIDILNADHIGGTGAGFEPQRVNNALLYIVGLSTNNSDPGGARDDVLQLSLMSFPIPKSNNGVLEVGYLNEKRKFAGLPTFDDLSVVFRDYVDQETARLLHKWRYEVYNPETGKIGLASAYKKKGWVTLFAPNGEFEREYELVGVWPSAMDPGDIDLSGEDLLNLTMTLTIDKAIPRQGLNPENREQIGSSAGRRRTGRS